MISPHCFEGTWIRDQAAALRARDLRTLEKKRKRVAFRSRLKNYTTEDFWKAMKDDLQDATRRDVETYRSLVLNTFSHYNTEKHEIRTELKKAIEAIKALRTELEN